MTPNEPLHEKTCFMPYANNKGTFVVHCLDSIMPPVFISEISNLQLTSKAEQADLCPTWSHTPEDRFSHEVAEMMVYLENDKHRLSDTALLYSTNNSLYLQIIAIISTLPLDVENSFLSL